jgi:hypothetical protein
MTTFNITAIVPDYQRSGNIGDDRRIPVGLRAADVVCNACGTSWRATPSRNPEPGHFLTHIGNFTLVCKSTSCGRDELIELRPLLLLAKGQHTVAITT